LCATAQAIVIIKMRVASDILFEKILHQFQGCTQQRQRPNAEKRLVLNQNKT